MATVSLVAWSWRASSAGDVALGGVLGQVLYHLLCDQGGINLLGQVAYALRHLLHLLSELFIARGLSAKLPGSLGLGEHLLEVLGHDVAGERELQVPGVVELEGILGHGILGGVELEGVLGSGILGHGLGLESFLSPSVLGPWDLPALLLQGLVVPQYLIQSCLLHHALLQGLASLLIGRFQLLAL